MTDMNPAAMPRLRRRDDAPLVSVVLPVFNAGPHLHACVRSLQHQDYPDLEIIAIDDGSTDGSAEVLRAYAAADPRIIVRTRENRGLIATLNEAIPLCRGDLIARMDADDIAYPQRLSVQVEAFLADADLAICGCRYDILYGRDRILRIEGLRQSEEAALAALAIFFPMLLHPTVMFRRSVVGDAALVYDSGYPFAEDFDLFRRIARRHRTRITDETLLAYRVHDMSVSATRKAAMRRTHIKIVAENLAISHGYGLDVRLAEIIDSVTADSVARAGRAITDLDAIAACAPPHLRPAYEEGVTNLFFFLYTIIWESGRTDLLRAFVGWCGRSRQIRRRERYLFRLRIPRLAGAIILKGFGLVDAVVRHFRSSPASRVIAGYDRL